MTLHDLKVTRRLLLPSSVAFLTAGFKEYMLKVDETEHQISFILQHFAVTIVETTSYTDIISC